MGISSSFGDSRERKREKENAVREALLELIEIRLTLRFGEVAKQVMEEIKCAEDVESLKFLKEVIAKASDIGEVFSALRSIKKN